MIRVKKKAFAVVAVAASVAMIAACSSSGSGKSGNGKSDAAQPPSKSSNNAVNQMNAMPRSGLKQGGKMTWAISQVIPNFNYYNVNGTLLDTINILNAIEPNPFHFNAAGDPSVDTDYFTSIKKIKSSPQTIEYKINPKAKWSDGSALSYQDMQSLWKSTNGANAKFSISGSQGWDQISSVNKGTDDQDVIVTFKTPYTDWQSLFQPLLPKSLTSNPKAFNNGWTGKPLVTAGPFKWGGANKTQKSYTIVRDSNWWGDPAMLDSITFAAYNDPSAAVQALGQHEIDYDDISSGDAEANLNAVRGYNGVSVRQAPGNQYRQFTFNDRDPILSDKTVRQAVVLGIDRAQITTALIGKLGGNPSPLQNHFFMKNQSAYTATCGEFCNYNPTKAKSLLEGDGWTMKGGYFEKKGTQLSLAITIPADTPNAKSEAELAQASLAKAGIKLTLNAVPSDDFFSKYIFSGSPSSNSKFQITTFTWIGTQFPVGGALSIFKFDPKAKGQNAGFGGDAAINTLLTNAATAPTSAKENALANEASKQMWDNASWLPLYQRPQSFGVTSGLANIGAYGFADIHYQDIGFKK